MLLVCAISRKTTVPLTTILLLPSSILTTIITNICIPAEPGLLLLFLQPQQVYQPLILPGEPLLLVLVHLTLHGQGLVTVDQLVDLFLVMGLLGSQLFLELMDLMLKGADGLVQVRGVLFMWGGLLSLELLSVGFRSVYL